MEEQGIELDPEEVQTLAASLQKTRSESGEVVAKCCSGKLDRRCADAS